MPNLSFVEMVVQVWLELEPEISHVLVASNVKRMPDGSKVGIEIETRNHLALVEAREHAMCLDTTIYDADAKNGKILAAGSCNDSAEIMGRLTVLRNALLL